MRILLIEAEVRRSFGFARSRTQTVESSFEKGTSLERGMLFGPSVVLSGSSGMAPELAASSPKFRARKLEKRLAKVSPSCLVSFDYSIAENAVACSWWRHSIGMM